MTELPSWWPPAPGTVLKDTVGGGRGLVTEDGEVIWQSESWDQFEDLEDLVRDGVVSRALVV